MLEPADDAGAESVLDLLAAVVTAPAEAPARPSDARSPAEDLTRFVNDVAGVGLLTAAELDAFRRTLPAMAAAPNWRITTCRYPPASRPGSTPSSTRGCGAWRRWCPPTDHSPRQ